MVEDPMEKLRKYGREKEKEKEGLSPMLLSKSNMPPLPHTYFKQTKPTGESSMLSLSKKGIGPVYKPKNPPHNTEQGHNLPKRWYSPEDEKEVMEELKNFYSNLDSSNPKEIIGVNKAKIIVGRAVNKKRLEEVLKEIVAEKSNKSIENIELKNPYKKPEEFRVMYEQGKVLIGYRIKQ